MKKRTVTVLKWIGIGVAGLSFVYGAWYWTSYRALQREYEALRAAGRPMSLEDIVPPYIPDTENAALLYRAASLLLQAEPPVAWAECEPPADRPFASLFDQLSRLATDLIENPTNAVASACIRQLLQHESVVAALDAVARGTQRPGHRSETDWSQGPVTLLPHLPDYRNLSRIMFVATRQQAADGDPDAAWRTALVGLRFADTLHSAPLIISMLVRVAQYGLANQAIRTVAEVSLPPEDIGTEIKRLLLAGESQEPLARSMDGERLVSGEWGFNLPGSKLNELAPVPRLAGIVFGRVFRPLLYRDHAAYLRIMRAYARNTMEPYSPNDEALEKKLLDSVPRYGFLTGLLMPALSAAKQRYTGTIAESRITRAGLAALRFRRKKGVFPPDLDALGVPDLEDPFTGQPLKYLVADTGFVIYSVGENLTDDGGLDTKQRNTGDIVWRYGEARKPE